ncbi:transposase [Motilibacter aurantiacus]|uniref:transposase n=1 Tax=Motilibacter aurantiacus TaxID=2714955 RepID=UPI00140D30E8|nr:transposase [Motilibacter aurantiacus]
MSEKRKYRVFTPDQKAEIVLAGLRGDRTVRDVCREYEIAETLYYQWRDRLLEGGKTALATPKTPGVPGPSSRHDLRSRTAKGLHHPRLPGRGRSWAFRAAGVTTTLGAAVALLESHGTSLERLARGSRLPLPQVADVVAAGARAGHGCSCRRFKPAASPHVQAAVPSSGPSVRVSPSCVTTRSGGNRRRICPGPGAEQATAAEADRAACETVTPQNERSP